MILFATAIPVAFVVAYFLTNNVRKWAMRREILDRPNERSSHSRPTPRGGGIGIALTTAAGTIFFAAVRHDLRSSSTVAFVVTALIIAGVSWIDDLRSLTGGVRIAVHLVVSTFAVAIIGPIPVSAMFRSSLPWFDAFMSVIWIVGLTNAFNFMDGIDGLAGLQALVTGLGWALVASSSGSSTIVGIGLVVAAASAAFLLQNWYPARIFMGDVGSAFLGCVFAMMPMMAPNLANATAPAVILVWPMVFDTSFTFLRRLRRGEAVFSAHRSHLYQRLVIAGWRHDSVSILYGALTAAAIPLAWWSSASRPDVSWIALIPIAALAAGLWMLTLLVERRTHARGSTSLPPAVPRAMEPRTENRS